MGDDQNSVRGTGALTDQGGGTAAGAPGTIWHWFGTAAAGFSLLFICMGLWACVTNLIRPEPVDFLSFWAAGKLVLVGEPSLAYDIDAHRAVEQLVLPITGLLPFSYPPPFLAMVAPFALTSFGIAFILWLALSGLFYAYAASRLVHVRYSFANPPVLADLLIGQTGLLTTGIFVIGLTLIASNPFLAGAVLGTLILKPQLALLLPVAMIAGREWRVIAGAIVSSAILLLGGLLLFGVESYRAFLSILPHYVGYLERSSWPWPELISPFAFARYFGVRQDVALGLHIVIAIGAAVVTARAWWINLDQRIPILAAATLLIPPYLFTYDGLLLLVPIAWFIRELRYPKTIAIVWLCCLVPILTYFGLAAPNLVWIGATICLVILHHDARQTTSRAMELPLSGVRHFKP